MHSKLKHSKFISPGFFLSPLPPCLVGTLNFEILTWLRLIYLGFVDHFFEIGKDALLISRDKNKCVEAAYFEIQ